MVNMRFAKAFDKVEDQCHLVIDHHGGLRGRDETRGGASLRETLEQGDFQSLADAGQMRAMERLVESLARRMRRRLARRERVKLSGNRVHLRHTLRNSLPFGGTPLRLTFRERRKRQPRLILITDVSRSMAMYSFLFPRFARGIVASFRDADAFACHTCLLHITDALRQPDQQRVAQSLTLISRGWSGGTRLGASLATFNRDYGRRLNSRTIVILASDGLDTGEPAELARQLAAIRGRCRRLIWLNPLLGRPGFEPRTGGMLAALPHLDLFAPAHNLQSLAAVDTRGEISGWIGGGYAQPAVIATAKRALDDEQPRLIRVSPGKGGEVEDGVIDFGMTCHSGGTLDSFLEPFTARPNLLIIGASPAAQALSWLAQRTGFEVAAAFPGADADMFPDARQVLDGLELSGLAGPVPSFVVVATQGKRNEPGLEAALGTGAPYIAFIASGRKADKLRTYLKERGHDPGRVDAIVSPAGIEIGAVTPEEIALSVLAGLVKVRRKDGAVPSAPTIEVPASQVQAPSAKVPDLPIAIAPAGGDAVNPVRGMTVAIATAEFRSEHQGQNYYFCCAGCQHGFEKAPEQYLKGAGTPA